MNEPCLDECVGHLSEQAPLSRISTLQMKSISLCLFLILLSSCSVTSPSQRGEPLLVSVHSTYLDYSPSTSDEAKQDLERRLVQFFEAVPDRNGMGLWEGADLTDAQYLGYSVVDLIGPDLAREVWLLVLSDEAHELKFCDSEDELVWGEPQGGKFYTTKDGHIFKFRIEDAVSSGRSRAPLHLSLSNQAGRKVIIDV